MVSSTHTHTHLCNERKTTGDCVVITQFFYGIVINHFEDPFKEKQFAVLESKNVFSWFTCF